MPQPKSQWLDRNTIISDKKLLVFVLSFLASSLPLVTNLIWESTAAVVFLVAFVPLLAVVSVLVRRQVSEAWKFKELNFLQSRWGTLAVATLGFGLGVLANHNRPRFYWLWDQFRKINRPDEWMLFSLFLLGVMLGFFVVRNWSKDQKEFVTSLTAVFGAAFVSTLLGQLSAQNGSVLTPQNTFSFYALGFSLSGALNLISFALLIGHYSRTKSLTSRSVIDFLYGSDKAQAIDGYFLKNFEADPNYAKVKLETALQAYRELIRMEFARKMNRRKDSLPESTSPPQRPDGAPAALDYFELLSIRNIPPGESQQSPPDDNMDAYEVVFRRLREKRPGEPGDAITPAMFRVAISMRWLDNLEYIVAPGEYRHSFPYYGSVAGLSLLAGRTIVMNRDKHRRFRTGTYVDGRTPGQADQPRGLYDIDYLSYISVPMSSSFGKPEEQSIGVLHIDTRLFACPKGTFQADDTYQPPDDDHPRQEIYRVIERVKKGQRLEKFEEYACNLYEENDPIIADLERLRTVIIPLLELYKKCRTGAINQPAVVVAATTTNVT